MESDKRILEYIKKQEALLEKEKAKDLISRGLYDLEFSEEYQRGYYYDSKYSKYVKKVPIDISDEDYEVIKKYKNSNKDSDSHLPNILNLIGFSIIIIGLIGGMFFIEDSSMSTILVWISAIISGIFYLALGKIIDLLENIKHNTEE